MTHGSEAHKTLFCQTFIDTHRSFEPETLPWPKLDASTIDRLRSIPFWAVALAAEQNAGKWFRVSRGPSRTRWSARPWPCRASRRRATPGSWTSCSSHYEIPVEHQPGNAWKLDRRSFIDFGYEECIDSFFGFGIFGLARQIQLFIPELTDIFEVILIEEARHVTFFVNWIAYERAHRGLGSLPATAFCTALGYARALRRIVSTFAPTAATAEKPRSRLRGRRRVRARARTSRGANFCGPASPRTTTTSARSIRACCVRASCRRWRRSLSLCPRCRSAKSRTPARRRQRLSVATRGEYRDGLVVRSSRVTPRPQGRALGAASASVPRSATREP